MDAFQVVGGDRRSLWAARRLRECGAAVQTFGVPTMPDAALPERFERLVLPFPSFSGRRLRGEGEITADMLSERVSAQTLVFGGLLDAVRGEFETRGATVFDLYGTEPLTTENAALTAEGAIEFAMSHSEYVLQGAPCLVIGCGRIGKALALRLKGLNAVVTVTARNPADLAFAAACGFATDQSGVYQHGLNRYRFLFNTVPASVLSAAQLAEISKECLLIELASAPFGFSEALCRELGLRAYRAAALPAACAPADAGRAYADAVLRTWKDARASGDDAETRQNSERSHEA